MRYRDIRKTLIKGTEDMEKLHEFEATPRLLSKLREKDAQEKQER